jgi:hypothetical protein
VASPPTNDLLGARVRMPQHVVCRSFVAETVVLNLQTGQYHGLNPTAGQMLDELRSAPTVGATVPALVERYGVAEEQIERDLLALAGGLLERGLIEIVDDAAG